MTTWRALCSIGSPSSARATDTNRLVRTSADGIAPRSESALANMLQTVLTQTSTAWTWVERKRAQQLASRRLRVAETIQLGEKRFVSIVQVDGAQFLIGGAAGGVSLLAVLDKQQGPGDHDAAQASGHAEVTR